MQQSHRIKVGDVFAHYKIIAELGQGGMGKVYKVWDNKLKREVALKTLLVQDSSNMEFIERFLREAQTIAQLQHPNIVHLYEINRNKGIYYYTMDYIKGGSLQDLVEKEAINIRTAAKLLKTITLALDCAHQHGIIHRDIKPSNILITDGLIPFITDFGLAKTITVEGDLTRTGAILGTPSYMSPEQAQGEKHIDKRSDVFSIGVILYWLITGQKPFTGTTNLEMLIRTIEKEPILPRDLNSQIPKDLEAICLKALAKKKHKRYSNAGKMANDLERFLRGQKVTARSLKGIARLWRKSPATLIVTIIVILCAIVATGLIIQPQKAISSNEVILTESEKLTASRHLAYARDLLKYKFYEGAREHLQRALKLAKSENIDKKEICELLIWVFVELKEYSNAQKYFRIVERNKLQTKTLLAMAKIYHHRQEFLSSLRFLTTALQQKSSPEIQAEVFYYLGLNNYHHQNYSQAAHFFHKCYTVLHKKYPTYWPDLLSFMGICSFQQQKFKQAIDHLTAAQKLLPNSAVVSRFVGRSFLKQNDGKEAKQWLERAVTLQPNSSNLQYWYGKSLLSERLYYQANETFSTALYLDKRNFNAMEGLFEVGFKRASMQNMQRFLYYTTRLSQITPPDLLATTIKKIEDTYHSNYRKWWKLTNKKQTSPDTFLTKLCEKHPLEIHDRAKAALLTLRYQKDLQKSIDTLLQNTDLDISARKRIKQTRQIIQNKKTKEQRAVTYYRTARLYLQPDEVIKRELELSGVESLEEILKDPQENSIHRYLAAKALISLLDFTKVETYSKSNDGIAAIVCAAALIEAKFPRPGEVFNKFSPQMDEFLKILIARNIASQIKVWPQLIKDTLKVQLQAASSIANIYQHPFAKPSLQMRKHARDILMQKTRHPSTKIREFAFFHLSKSFTLGRRFQNLGSSTHILKDGSPYSKTLLRGLRDKELAVKLAIVSHAVHVDSAEYITELIHLRKQMKGQIDASVRILFNVAICNNKHPIFQQIVEDQQAPTVLRIWAFIVLYLNFNSYDLKSYWKIREQTIKQLLKLFGDPNIHFRRFALFIASIMGMHPIELIETETNPQILSILLQTISTKLPYFDLNTTPITKRLSLVEKFISHQHPEIRHAAIYSQIILAVQKRAKIFRQLTNSADKTSREGASQAFYDMIIYGIMQSSGPTEMFKMTHPEERYQLFIDQLVKQGQNPEKLQAHIGLLTASIQLHDGPRRRYERAVLWQITGDNDRVLIDLQQAQKTSPHYLRYALALAKFHLKMKTGKQIEPLLQEALTGHHYERTIHETAELAFHNNKIEIAEKIYSKLCLLKPSYPYYFTLACCRARNKDYTGAFHYLRYAKMYSKIRYKHMAGIPEFSTMMNDPRMKDLLK